MERRNREDRPPESIFRDEPEEILTKEVKKELWRHAARILLGNGHGCGGVRFCGYPVYDATLIQRRWRGGEEDVDVRIVEGEAKGITKPKE